MLHWLQYLHNITVIRPLLSSNILEQKNEEEEEYERQRVQAMEEHREHLFLLNQSSCIILNIQHNDVQMLAKSCIKDMPARK